MREKLIELIDDFIYDVDIEKWYSEELDEKLADYLIQNGVVEVDRCKDCRWRDPEDRQRDHFMGTVLPFSRKDDDFCSYGERRAE